MNLRTKSKTIDNIKTNNLSLDEMLKELNEQYYNVSNIILGIHMTYWENSKYKYMFGTIKFNKEDNDLEYNICSYGKTILEAVTRFYNKDYDIYNGKKVKDLKDRY